MIFFLVILLQRLIIYEYKEQGQHQFMEVKEQSL